MTQAIDNVTKKARLIASNLNVTLGGVKTVEYGQLEYGGPRLRRAIWFVPPTIEMNEKAEKSSSWNTYGIMENDVSETIIVVGEIQDE